MQPMRPDNARNPNPIDAWHAMVSAGDPTGLDALLADDAVFVSPVVHAPQRGKAMTKAYLSAAFSVFFNSSFRYIREIVGASDAMLEFETEIDELVVNGVDIIKWNRAGEIIEFKVMIRPLKAVNLVHERMAAMLAGGGKRQ
jgi:ketosteroid isomerase-like protein